MPTQVIALEDDTIDLVVFRELGIVNEGLLEETYALNPDISHYGLLLPGGTSVVVPDLPANTIIEGTIKLYD